MHAHRTWHNMTGLFAGSASSQPFSLDSKSLSPRQVIWNRGRNRWGVEDVEVIQASLAPSFTFGSRTLWLTWLAWMAIARRRFWLFKVMAIWRAFTPCPVLMQAELYFERLTRSVKKIKSEHVKLFIRHGQQDVNWPGFRNNTIWNQAKWQEILSWETWMILNVGTPALICLGSKQALFGFGSF